MGVKLTCLLLIFSTSITPAITAAPLDITLAWIREAPPTATVLAAYMDIKNISEHEQIITGASSPDFKRIEIHHMSLINGMMNMKPLEQIRIQPNETIRFAPNTNHFMLVDPQKAFTANVSTNIVIELHHAPSIIVPAVVHNINDPHHFHKN